MHRSIRRDRKEPLEQPNHDTQHSKNDDGENGIEGALRIHQPENRPASDEQQRDTGDNPARPYLSLALLVVSLRVIELLSLLLCLHRYPIPQRFVNKRALRAL